MPLRQFVIHTPQRITGIVCVFSHPYDLVISRQVFIILKTKPSITGLVRLILVLCQLATQPLVPADRTYHSIRARARDSQGQDGDSPVQHQRGFYHTIPQQDKTTQNEEIARPFFERQFLKIRHFLYSLTYCQ